MTHVAKMDYAIYDSLILASAMKLNDAIVMEVHDAIT